MTSDDGAEKDVGLELSMGPCGEIEPFGEMWDNEHSHRDSYSPGFTEVSDAPSALASGYKPDNALERSWQQLGAKPLQQFWEHGFWGEIFGNDSDASSSAALTNTLGLHRPIVPMHTGEVELLEDVAGRGSESNKRLKHATYMDVVSNCSVQTWREQRDSMWETAVRRWHSCIMSWDGDDAIIGLVKNKEDFKAQCQIVVDVLHNKAPATLLKRCNSISRLVNDLHKHGRVFPCSEEDLYDHLCRQRDEAVPSSRLKSLLEAVTFVRHMFGVVGLELCTKSRRCMGVATPIQVNIIKQAPPLRVEHLLALHHVIDSDEDPWNICFAGMVLFCVYGRARWSDAQHSQHIEWDMDLEGQICYVECSTAVHKTCRALNMRHSFLPLTAPGLGVGERNWADAWRRARLQLEIDDLSYHPLMPAPDEHGQATVRPLSTKEAGGWLTLLLRQKVEVLNLSEPLNYTSHSFKATALSYLAKYGCSFEDRLALGYHVDQVRMALRYSRDGASRPLRVLETCLTDIRTGKFKPDVTRSGRFVRSLDLGAEPVGGDVAENLHVKQEVVLASSGVFEAGEVVDITSDHVTTCSDSSSDDNAVVMPKNPTRTLLIPQGVDVWKHVKLKTVHLALEGYVRILACGRKISENYQKGGVDVRFDIIKCRQCFNSSILKDV